MSAHESSYERTLELQALLDDRADAIEHECWDRADALECAAEQLVEDKQRSGYWNPDSWDDREEMAELQALAKRQARAQLDAHASWLVDRAFRLTEAELASYPLDGLRSVLLQWRCSPATQAEALRQLQARDAGARGCELWGDGEERGAA